jgi:hypothetical protein
MLPDEIKPALQGTFPAIMATCSLDGTPNCTVISQVFWVDPAHVALSFQFFNKTIRNVRENPFASVRVVDPFAPAVWTLELQFDHSETSGPVFDNMDMQLEAIASMSGLSGVFKLKASDIYRVLSVRKNTELFRPPANE